MSESENGMYILGRSEAREVQFSNLVRREDPRERQQKLLEFARNRDAMKNDAQPGNLEEALANYLDGYLSVWD